METIVCVGAVVLRRNKVLLVRQAEGHPLEGQWTVPWGKLESAESPSAAVLRETHEEAGVSADIQGLLGVQELPPPWEGQVAILYLCDHAGGEPVPDNRETDAAMYFDLEEIDALSEPVEPLTAWLVRRILRGKYTLVSTDDSNPFHPIRSYL